MRQSAYICTLPGNRCFYDSAAQTSYTPSNIPYAKYTIIYLNDNIFYA